MIDIANEELVPIDMVPDLLPPRRSGRKIHKSAVYRWIQRGVRGVRVEAVRIGGRTYTSVEALQRSADRQTAGRSTTSTAPAATKTRQRQVEQAATQVEKILGTTRSRPQR